MSHFNKLLSHANEMAVHIAEPLLTPYKQNFTELPKQAGNFYYIPKVAKGGVTKVPANADAFNLEAPASVSLEIVPATAFVYRLKISALDLERMVSNPSRFHIYLRWIIADAIINFEKATGVTAEIKTAGVTSFTCNIPGRPKGEGFFLELPGTEGVEFRLYADCVKL